MLDFPRSREPKPLWSSCFLISPALQDKKFVGNLIRVHYQHEKKQCEVHSIFIFSIFFSNCRLKPVKNNSRMPVWQKSTEQLKCDKIREIFWSHVVNISQKKKCHIHGSMIFTSISVDRLTRLYVSFGSVVPSGSAFDTLKRFSDIS